MIDWGQLQAAAYRKLMRDPAFQQLIAVKDIGRDVEYQQIFPDMAYVEGWVHQGISVTGLPARDPTSTGTSAVTLSIRNGWSSANEHNTASFPQLLVYIFSDLTRPTQDNGMIVARDAEHRCARVARVITNVFHDPGNFNQFWGSPSEFPPTGIQVHRSSQAGQLNITDVAMSDGLVRGELRFNLTTD